MWPDKRCAKKIYFDEPKFFTHTLHMKRILIITLLLITLCTGAQAQLGDVATISMTTANLDSSLAFYEKLGFTKIASNDYPFHWAQVSDGSLLITLRNDAAQVISLSYFTNDLDNVIAQLEKNGVTFFQRPKEGDPLRRYYIKSPDGLTIVVSSNLAGFKQPTGITLLNMKPEDFGDPSKYPNPQCGVFGEFAQPVADLEASIAFWTKLGFTVKAQMKTPYPYAILTDGKMILGLHQESRFNYPAITYFGGNTEKRVRALKEKGLTHITEFTGPKNQAVVTWEGQHFFLFTLGM
jgi:predicted lactoylglutathione lyase